MPASANDEASMLDLVAKAKQGDSRSQMTLAYRYRDGNGVKRDYAEGRRPFAPGKLSTSSTTKRCS